MNQKNKMDKLPVLTMLAALFTLIFTGCEDAPAPAKVLEAYPVVIERPSQNLVIRRIYPDGTVAVGVAGQSVSVSVIDRHSLRLEGKAQINDPVIFVWHYEDQVLENGQVRRQTMSVGVKSKHNQEIEQRLEILKGEKTRLEQEKNTE